MSFPLEKLPGERLTPTSQNCTDQTDWLKVEAMDDEDIVFTEDSPDTSAMDWSHSVLRIGGRPCSSAELDQFRQFCVEYANRPRQPK